MTEATKETPRITQRHLAMSDPAARHLRLSLRQVMAVIAGMALLFAVIAEVARTTISWWISQALELALYGYPQLAWMAGAGVLVALIAAAVDRLNPPQAAVPSGRAVRRVSPAGLQPLLFRQHG
jgi:hypothetical protein